MYVSTNGALVFRMASSAADSSSEGAVAASVEVVCLADDVPPPLLLLLPPEPPPPPPPLDPPAAARMEDVGDDDVVDTPGVDLETAAGLVLLLLFLFLLVSFPLALVVADLVLVVDIVDAAGRFEAEELILWSCWGAGFMRGEEDTGGEEEDEGKAIDGVTLEAWAKG